MLSLSLRRLTAPAPALIFVTCAAAHADVSLPRIYSDHMVLQRRQPVPIRGLASPGEKVTVELTGKSAKAASYAATAAADGTWSVTLKPQEAGGPYRIRVRAKNVIELQDVLFGEVWLCSGQSNMATTVATSKDADTEIAAAHHPNLRIFSTNFAARNWPLSDVVAGAWQPVTPQTIPNFSAVGYYFGRDLQRETKIPIGLVCSSVGGTVIESWLNQPALALEPPDTSLQNAYQKPEKIAPIDDAGWQSPSLETAQWKSMPVPGAWEKSGQGMDTFDGAVWFRREVDVPAAWAGKPLQVNLGPIDDGDVTYFNGVRIGAMNVDTPNVWKLPRRYTVPAALVKAGRAVLAVRITDQLGDGGFVGQPQDMWLAPDAAPAPEDRLSLAGAWQYKVAEAWPSTGLPTALYNGLVAPWTALPIAGVVWYQGESNAGNAANYRRLLPRLITGWRAAWNRPDLPFLIVQLPGYGTDGPAPADSQWAALREAQAETAASMPGVHLAVTLDLGEVNNIHPKNKQDVGDRLARLALARVYGDKRTATGPTCDSARIEDGAVVLHFKNIGRGLVVHGDALKGFAIAGADRKFVWATVALRGETVTVQSPDVPAPLYVRYAWANSPVATLYNSEGLPAAPFRTENTAVIPGN